MEYNKEEEEITLAFSQLEIPSEEEIFQEGIDKRNNFSEFVLQHIESTINIHLIETLKNIQKNTPSVNVIGGSRSWDKYFNKDLCNFNKKVSELSSIEKTAIVPGNYDIFCFCSDKSKIDYIMFEMCVCLDKIVQELNDSDIGNYFELHWDNNGNTKRELPIQLSNTYSFNFSDLEADCPVNVEPLNEGCVFPSCNSIDLELMFSKHPDLPKNTKGIPRKGKKYFNLEILQTFHRKVLLYFEVIFIDEPSLKNIKKYLINKDCKKDKDKFNYLNLEGLYLLSELIVKRSDKDYDVDLYRSKILDKVIAENKIDIKDFYKNLITIYKNTFASRSDYSLKVNLLLKKYIEILQPNILTDYSSEITERARPFINSFIIDISHILRHDINNYKEDDAYIFITGGDAYRRYLYDIKKTNDIDTKIVYKDKKDEVFLMNQTVYSLSQLIAALYSNKQNIFKDLNVSLKLDNINLTFRPVYNAGQFRLRLIKRNDFILFSIDYRYKLDIEMDNQKYTLNNEIAILDVVLQHNPKNFQTLRSNNVKDFCGIPVASDYYLINDLRKMYETINEDVRRRFPKSSKDKDRFIKLINFVKKYIRPPYTETYKKRRASHELPDISELNDLFPRKRVNTEFIRPKRFIPIEYLFKVQSNIEVGIACRGDLNTRIDFNSYSNSLHSVQTFIENYKNLFFKTYTDEITKDPESQKISMQFNDIMDVFNTMNLDSNIDLLGEYMAGLSI